MSHLHFKTLEHGLSAKQTQSEQSYNPIIILVHIFSPVQLNPQTKKKHRKSNGRQILKKKEISWAS